MDVRISIGALLDKAATKRNRAALDTEKNHEKAQVVSIVSSMQLSSLLILIKVEEENSAGGAAICDSLLKWIRDCSAGESDKENINPKEGHTSK